MTKRVFLSGLTVSLIFFTTAEISSKTSSDYYKCEYVNEGVVLREYNSRTLLHVKVNTPENLEVSTLLKSKPVLIFPREYDVQYMGNYISNFNDLYIVISVKDKVPQFKKLTVAAEIGKKVEKLLFI